MFGWRSPAGVQSHQRSMVDCIYRSIIVDPFPLPNRVLAVLSNVNVPECENVPFGSYKHYGNVNGAYVLEKRVPYVELYPCYSCHVEEENPYYEYYSQNDCVGDVMESTQVFVVWMTIGKSDDLYVYPEPRGGYSVVGSVTIGAGWALKWFSRGQWNIQKTKSAFYLWAQRRWKYAYANSLSYGGTYTLYPIEDE